MTTAHWKSGVSGDWGTASDWSTGAVPGSSTDVVIDPAGTYTVTIDSAEAAHSLLVDAVGASVADNNTFTVGTTLTVQAGVFQLDFGGDVVGGTLAATGGSFLWQGGALTGVTYDGALDLSRSFASLIVAGGLTVTGAGGTGPGTINDTGDGSQFMAAGGQTLSNATLDIGNAGFSYFRLYDPSHTAPILTLGATFAIVQAGGSVYLSDEFGYAGDGLVNNGSISAGFSGGTFYILTPNLTNNGSITISNGDSIDSNPTSFVNGATGVITVTGPGSAANIGSGASWTNAGTIVFGAGTTDYIDQYASGTWTNAGTISVASGASLSLGGTFTSAQLAGISNASGAITVAGAMVNTGSTLTIGTGTGEPVVDLAGTIVGGAILDQGQGMRFDGGALSGVTYEGAVDLSATNASLIVEGGFTATGLNGTGPGTIDDTGVGSEFWAAGGQTLSNATLDFGSAATSYFFLYNSNDTTPVLTLGATFAIVQTGAHGDLYDPPRHADDVVVNNGAITAGFAHGSFDITLLAFTNNGALTVANGDTLDVQPTSFTNLAGATLTGGRYEVDAGSTLQLNNNATIVTDKATIILSGAGSAIESLDTTTSRQVAIDATLTTIAAGGTLEILGGRNWTSALAVSNAGALQLAGGTLTVASLANTGATSGYGVLATSLTNTGAISVAAGQTLSLVGGSLTNLSGATLTGGTYGVGAGGTLQLANNSAIATLDATIVLKGGAMVQSLNTTTSKEVGLGSSLTTIGAIGSLQLSGAGTFTAANAVANAGLLQLGGATFAGGALTDAAGSTLTGFGTVASVFSGGGSVTASGGALSFSGTADEFATALGGSEIDFVGGADALRAGSSLTAATIGLSGGAALTLGAGQAVAGTWNQGSSTVDLAGFTLTLSGTGNLLGGAAIDGSGTLVFSGGTQTMQGGVSLGVANWSLAGGALTSVDGDLDYAGAFSDTGGATLQVNGGDTLTLSGDSTVTSAVVGAGTLDLTGGAVAFGSGASVSAASLAVSGGAVVTLGANLAYAGALAEDATSTVAIGANTLTLNGGDSVLAGAVTGTGGTLALAGGTMALDGGASLGLSAWTIGGGTASLNESLTFAGAFNEGAGGTLTVAAADTLTLTGAAGLGGVINGAGTVAIAGATVGGLTVGGTDTLSVTGAASQTGKVTIGDAGKAAATLSIAKGASWTINGAVGISHGTSTKSTLKVAGALIRSGGSGTSVINLATSVTGTIEAVTGALDFSGRLAGTGTLKIDAGATLESGKTVAATVSTMFNGAGATLALKKPTGFASTISGLTVGDTIDLLKIAATGASVDASDRLVIVNGSTTAASLQLAGSYSGATFTVGSDGHGGTDVTLLTTARADPRAFAAAMAALGGGGGSGAAPGVSPEGGSAPRMVLPGSHG